MCAVKHTCLTSKCRTIIMWILVIAITEASFIIVYNGYPNVVFLLLPQSRCTKISFITSTKE